MTLNAIRFFMTGLAENQLKIHGHLIRARFKEWKNRKFVTKSTQTQDKKYTYIHTDRSSYSI